MSKIRDLVLAKEEKERYHSLLGGVIQLIVKKYSPEKLILFGSQVKGNVDEFSDFDFIVIKKTNKPFLQRLAEFPILPIHADILIYTPEEFKRMQKEGNPFFEKVLINSRVIYERVRGRS